MPQGLEGPQGLKGPQALEGSQRQEDSKYLEEAEEFQKAAYVEGPERSKRSGVFGGHDADAARAGGR